ncbi:MAG: transposase [Desulfomonile tiedjei]|nr:transposase [Desulfomonile tiedjei]
MGRSRYKQVEGHQTYFATCTVIGWLPLFTKPELAEVVLSALKFLHEEDRLALHAYVLMENHLHLIGTANDFSNELRNFKSFTAKKIVELLRVSGSSFYLTQMHFLKKHHKTNQTYQVWQEGSHLIAIVNEEALRQKTEYIHFNPVRRGYVNYPEHWRYSSAQDYCGQTGLVPVEVIF